MLYLKKIHPSNLNFVIVLGGEYIIYIYILFDLIFQHIYIYILIICVLCNVSRTDHKFIVVMWAPLFWILCTPSQFLICNFQIVIYIYIYIYLKNVKLEY